MIKKILLCSATLIVATTSFAASDPAATLKACLASPVVKTLPNGYDLCYINYTNAIAKEAQGKFINGFYGAFLGSTIPGFKPPTGTTDESGSNSGSSTSSQPQQEQQQKTTQPASIRF